MTKSLIFLAVLLTTVTVAAQLPSRIPHLDYVYPAGGKSGTTFLVVIGGQNLNGNLSGIVSGDGVKVVEIKLFQPFKASVIPRKELQEIMKTFKNGRITLPPPPAPPRATVLELVESLIPFLESKPSASKVATPSLKPKDGKAELTREQLIEQLRPLTPLELELIAREVLTPRNALQINPALAQKVIAKIVIAPNAKPGFRELRVLSGDGLSNPVRFAVGTMQETKEPPYSADRKNPVGNAIFPAVLNGQIMPGEVSCWKFKASAGQFFSFTLYGRFLTPFLGDAVPGWFQPAIGIYNAQNREIAFADSYNFAPDPKLAITIPATGDYELRIRDTLYRGREDFVYRVVVSADKLRDDLLPPPIEFQLPRIDGSEPNDSIAAASPVEFPALISGVINPAGDVDTYRFHGKEGDEIVAEIFARRLNSPLDSLLRLTDASGNVIAWNDDFPRPNIGIQTHYADSFLRCKLPRNSDYYLQVSDSQSHGGSNYVYSLRLDSPRPDFELYLTPSALNVSSGLSSVFSVHAVRKDGFNGEIEVVWPGAPTGFKLSGNRIPSGVDRLRMTLTVPDRVSPSLIPAGFEGQAVVSGKTIRHPLVPTDEQMQAFAYMHLVPAENLTVAVLRRMHLPIQPPCPAAALKIVPGQTVAISFPSVKIKPNSKLEFELADPPPGIALANVAVTADGKYTLTFSADAKTAKPGTKDNLIVRCAIEATDASKNKPPKRNRSNLGVLPAVPLEVMSPTAKP